MKTHNQIRDMIVFAMLAALMFASKIVFEPLPNIHPIAMLIMVFTLVYRVRALIPLYLFILIFGLYYGFSIWWIPYLYIWTVLWGVTMLLPKKLSPRASMILYPLVCFLFGLLYGVLYAPAQAILFGYDLPTTLTWIAFGLRYDLLHGIGNLGMGLLIYPLTKLLWRIHKQTI